MQTKLNALISVALLTIVSSAYAEETANDGQSLAVGNSNCNPKPGNVANADNSSWNGMPGPDGTNQAPLVNNNQPPAAGNAMNPNYAWQPPNAGMMVQMQPNQNGVNINSPTRGDTDFNVKFSAQGNKLPNPPMPPPWMMGYPPGNYNQPNENNAQNVGIDNTRSGMGGMGMNSAPWGGGAMNNNYPNPNMADESNSNNQNPAMGMGMPPAGMNPWAMRGMMTGYPGAINHQLENRLDNIEKRLDDLIKQIQNLSHN